MKLIKVMAGLYRNEDGSVHVFFRPKWFGEPKHWLLKYTNFFGATVEKKFDTLRELREHLEEHSFV